MKWTKPGRMIVLAVAVACVTNGCSVMKRLGYVPTKEYSALEERQMHAAAEIANLRSTNEQLGMQFGATEQQLVGQIGTLKAEVADLQGQLIEAGKPKADPQLAIILQQLEDLASGSKIQWNAARQSLVVNLTFALGSANVTPEEKASLAPLAARLQNVPPGYTIYVDGHTADLPVKNPATIAKHVDLWGLGSNRALAVMRALLELGAPQGRLIPRSFADTQPLVRGTTPEARKKNRRVEITIEPALSR